MSKLCCAVVSFVFAAMLIAGGACVFMLVPNVIKRLVREALIVDTPASSSFPTFLNSSSKTDIYNSFYIFHCTNPYDVMYNMAQPNLVQKGPYNYLTIQWREEDTMSWRSNATVEYRYHETYAFDPALSHGSENDMITTLNMGLLGVLYKERANPFLDDIVKFFLSGQEIFVNMTVGELLWGYNYTFLSKFTNDTVVPMLVSDDPQYFTSPSAIYTGGKTAANAPQPPSNSMNHMTMWAGYEKKLPFWGSDYANMINGTDGSCLTPGVSESDSPYVFVDTLYRSVRLAFDSKQTYEGVNLLRFCLSKEDTLSGEANHNNKAFFMNETGFLSRPPSKNQPIVMSKPHFLDANLTNVRVNITPSAIDRELYETALDVEATTGLLFRVHKRIQTNLFLDPSIYLMTLSPNFSATWYPIFWGDEYMDLPTTLVDDFKRDVQLPLDLATYGGIGACSFGGALALFGILLILCCREKDDAHHVFHSNSELNAESMHGSYY